LKNKNELQKNLNFDNNKNYESFNSNNNILNLNDNNFSKSHNRMFSSDMFDKSIIKPIYSDRNSFDYFIDTDYNNNLYKYKTDSRIKYQKRIKKEIDLITQNFANEIVPNYYNKPLAFSIPQNSSKFSTNYISTISNVKYDHKKNKNNNINEVFETFIGLRNFKKKKGLLTYEQFLAKNKMK